MKDWRRCTACKTKKPAECFYRVATRGDTRRTSKCKECLSIYQKARYLRNRDQMVAASREARLIRMYGMTAKDYDDMLDRQHYACAICLRTQDKLSRLLAVDHCHETGKVRGLLCDVCNTTLGYWNEDPTIAYAAGDYIANAREEAG